MYRRGKYEIVSSSSFAQHYSHKGCICSRYALFVLHCGEAGADLVIDLDDSHESFLWHVHFAHGLHPLLALGLLG